MRRAIAAAVACAAIGATVALAGSGSESATWSELAPSPLARTEVAAARVGRHAYVVGGFEQTSNATTQAVARYDLTRDRWERVRSLPVGVNHASATAHGAYLYVAGGYTAERDLTAPSARLYRYDPRRNSWRRLRDAPTARGAHTMQAIGGRLYLVGGVGPDGVSGALEIYDIRSRKWSRGPAM